MNEKLHSLFWVLGYLYKIRSGRRRMAAELMYRTLVVHIETNAASFAPMNPRKQRRSRIRELRKMSGLPKKKARETFVFRPVYGYRGPGAAKS